MVDEQEVELRVAKYIQDMPERMMQGKNPDELWQEVYEQIHSEMQAAEDKEQNNT